MKKLITIVVSTAMMISIVGTSLENPCVAASVVSQTASIESNNPIEKVFAKDFKIASATAEINYVAEKYEDAWMAELKNVATQIKKSYKYKEDVKRVDDYVTAYNALAKKAFDIEMLNWSDLSKPQGKRTFGTGGPGAALLAEAKIYKQATLNLIQHYKSMNPGRVYKFAYKGNGAEIEKLRKQ
jgi:ABC-type proline/glycine betaine transport system substrate-binding protein